MNIYVCIQVKKEGKRCNEKDECINVHVLQYVSYIARENLYPHECFRLTCLAKNSGHTIYREREREETNELEKIEYI